MKMYRNYDGNDSTFGGTGVLATEQNPDNLSAFASQRSKDGALTVMVINKYLTGNTPVVVNLTNFIGSGTAQNWQLNASQVITQLPNLPYSAGTLQTTVPPQSITLLVIEPKPLSLGSGLSLTNGQFQFSANGEVGAEYILESSSDLVNWSSVSTNTFGVSGQAQFQLSGGGTEQFYRAVVVSW
jgi:hypothetical protein